MYFVKNKKKVYGLIEYNRTLETYISKTMKNNAPGQYYFLKYNPTHCINDKLMGTYSAPTNQLPEIENNNTKR